MSKDNAALVVSERPAGELAPADPLAAFGEFIRLHVAEGDASPRTVRAYMGEVARFVAWCRKVRVTPAQANPDDLVSYRAALVKHGYARGTIALKLAAVRRFYEAAIWAGLRTDNPAAGLKAPRERAAAAERVKFLPLDGLRRLLDAPQVGGGPESKRAKAVRDRAILALLGMHGLRLAEVAGLQVSDFDPDGGEVGAATVHGKGDKTRTVYLVAASRERLGAWLQERPALAQPGERALFVSTHAGGNPPQPKGTGMDVRAIRDMIDRYLQAEGLKKPGISAHSLRHSAATWARAGGAKLDSLALMLGHSNMETTRIYAQVVRRIEENPARYLSDLLWSGD